jgi:hypothetical protein
MRQFTWVRITAAAAMFAVGMVAAAKLPAPTPEQAQAAATKKEQEAAQLEKEKQLLEQSQDRVAAHYRRTKGAAAPAPQPTGRTEATNMPKVTKELPRDAGPRGGTKQSAEAHSAPAK